MNDQPGRSQFLPRKPAPSPKRTREDQEFLPAALEILETPPSPVKIAFLLFICALAIFAVAWTWFGKFDIVATAQGKVQPTGRVKIVQSAILGKIVSLPVPNGTPVEEGEVLVRLDDAELQAEKSSLTTELAALRAETIRRRSAIDLVGSWRERPLWLLTNVDLTAPMMPPEIPHSVAQREQLIYSADLAQLVSTLRGFSAQRKQQLAELEGITQAMAVRSDLVKTLAERVDMRTTLESRETGSRASVIDAVEIQQKEEADLRNWKGAPRKRRHPSP